MRDYARVFGLRTAVFRHSAMYGGQQHATFDQGWVGWFCQKGLEIRRAGGSGEVSISGTGKQVRDVLHASDVVSLYFAALERIDAVRGEAFNIGGGVVNSLSLMELFALLESVLGIKVAVRRGPQRLGDQRVFIADNAKAEKLLDWRPRMGYEQGIGQFLDWLARNGKY
jgi:CDP-paratose 2-epimerase